MPYLATSHAWLHQSAQLLQARPTTTRITTKYTISPPTSNTTTKPNTKTPAPTAAPGAPPAAPKALLTLKTYDPASGTCLKYKTDKAAEVGRLIGSLHRLGKRMSGVAGASELEDADALDTAMPDAPPATSETPGASTPVPESAATKNEGQGQAPKQTGGAQGGKKKKKGKK